MNQPVEIDSARLRSQQHAVLTIMLDGRWRTIPELTQAAIRRLGRPCMQTSIASKVRALRSRKNGGYVVDRERISEGLWRYRMRYSGEPQLGLFSDDCPDPREVLG